jgi:hypothetical protein
LQTCFVIFNDWFFYSALKPEWAILKVVNVKKSHYTGETDSTILSLEADGSTKKYVLQAGNLTRYMGDDHDGHESDHSSIGDSPWKEDFTGTNKERSDMQHARDEWEWQKKQATKDKREKMRQGKYESSIMTIDIAYHLRYDSTPCTVRKEPILALLREVLQTFLTAFSCGKQKGSPHGPEYLDCLHLLVHVLKIHVEDIINNEVSSVPGEIKRLMTADILTYCWRPTRMQGERWEVDYNPGEIAQEKEYQAY